MLFKQTFLGVCDFELHRKHTTLSAWRSNLFLDLLIELVWLRATFPQPVPRARNQQNLRSRAVVLHFGVSIFLYVLFYVTHLSRISPKNSYADAVSRCAWLELRGLLVLVFFCSISIDSFICCCMSFVCTTFCAVLHYSYSNRLHSRSPVFV